MDDGSLVVRGDLGSWRVHGKNNVLVLGFEKLAFLPDGGRNVKAAYVFQVPARELLYKCYRLVYPVSCIANNSKRLGQLLIINVQSFQPEVDCVHVSQDCLKRLTNFVPDSD